MTFKLSAAAIGVAEKIAKQGTDYMVMGDKRSFHGGHGNPYHEKLTADDDQVRLAGAEMRGVVAALKVREQTFDQSAIT